MGFMDPNDIVKLFERINPTNEMRVMETVSWLQAINDTF